MSQLLASYNLSVQDPQFYFSAMWSSFSSIQAIGVHTDLEMVGNTKMGWGSVKVHKPIVLPLFPILSQMLDCIEDSRVVFTEVSLEVIKSVVHLIYTGHCTLSAVVTVESILDMIKSLGVCLQLDRLEVVKSTEIAGFKKIGNRNEPTVSDINHNKQENVELERKNVVEEEAISESDVHPKFIDTTDESRESKLYCGPCEFNCRYCSQMIEHTAAVFSENNFSCEYCDFKSPNLVSIKHHKKNFHVGSEKYSGDVCVFNTMNLDKLKWHKMLNHTKRKVTKNHVNQKQADESYIKEVFRRPLERAPVREDITESIEEEAVKANLHEQFICNEAVITGYEKLNNNVEEQTRQHESDAGRSASVKEDVVTSNNLNYNDAVRGGHEKIKKNVEKEAQQYECEECGQKCKTRYKLIAHMHQYHLIDLPIRCRKCNVESKNIQQNKAHMEEFHTERVSCKHCGKSVKKDVLKAHMESHMSDREVFSCHTCDYQTFVGNNLKVHLRSHSEKKVLECRKCVKKFKWDSSLKSHMLAAHSKNVSTFKCEICKHSFKEKVNLNKHMFTHQAEKPNNCRKCGKGWIRADFLKNHKCNAI